MKLPLLFCGCLLVLFSEHMALGQNLDWQQKMQDKMDRIQREMEAKLKNIQAHADKIQQEAKDKEDQLNAQLQLIKQKCAKKQSNNATAYNGKTVGFSAQEINDLLHFRERTVNPTTNKIEEIHYTINRNDPNAEPTCGQPTR